MSNSLDKIPVSPIISFGNPSVPNGATFGTNFSILQTGGYMEVYNLSGLTYTIPPATTGVIEFSGNSIPIQLVKGSGSAFSPDVLTLNSDNISSGRRKLGMLVYVYETNKLYQFRIDNYDTLWNNATGATGIGGNTVVISDYGTTVRNNSAAGIAFINAWTASTISGIGGYNDTNASWRILKTGGDSFTGGTVTGATNFTGGLSANTISATTYQNLPATPFLPLSGGTVTGATNFTGSITSNTISATTITVNNISGTTKLIGLQTFQGTTASDTAPLGVELTTTGTSDSSWTGTSFASGYTHIPGSATTLVSPLTAITGTYYYILCNISNRTAGTITIDFGGYSNSNLSATTINYGPLATTTGALIVTPTTDFNGTITVSVKTIGTSSSTTTFTNSSGSSVLEIRADNIGTNTFLGLGSGRRNFAFNNQGIQNTFVGQGAGQNNTTGRFNTFIGKDAGINNNIGFSNTFIGTSAGYSNTYGFNNTFIGDAAGANTTTGTSNTSLGQATLNVNTTGLGNTAIGNNSLKNLLNSSYNTAVGNATGLNLTGGTDNILLGSNAGRFISGGAINATNIGSSIIIGVTAYPLGNSQTNQIVIGHQSIGLGSNTTVLGNTSTTTSAIYGNLLLGTTVNTGQKLQVSGNTLMNGGLTGNTALFSSSTQNVLKIIGSGNSTTSPIFTVQGSQGELFSVNDTLIGSLFSVNDISGLPVLEAFSDNTVLMGSYIAPSLNTTIKVIAVTGLTNIYSIPTSAYTGAFFDYTISNGTNLRGGNIMSVWNSGTTIQYRETSTNDIGNTSGLTFNMIVSGSTAILRTSGVTGNWTIKTIVRSI
jgi:hypothetical protein